MLEWLGWIIELLKFVGNSSSWIINTLPSQSRPFFMFAVAASIGYGLSSFGKTLCRILMVAFWGLFFLFMGSEILHT